MVWRGEGVVGVGRLHKHVMWWARGVGYTRDISEWTARFTPEISVGAFGWEWEVDVRLCGVYRGHDTYLIGEILA